MPDESKPPQIENPNFLVGTLCQKIKDTLRPEGSSAESVLEWLKSQKPSVIRQSITATQPQGWAVASAPLVESMSDDQCVGLLCALMAVFVQTM